MMDLLLPPREATGDDHASAIDVIVGQQANAERNIPSLGTDRDGVIAELDDLDPPWTETLRVMCTEDGEVIGVVLVDWDTESHRSWIHGPWVAVDDARWPGAATELIDAAVSQIPTDIDKVAMTAVVDRRLFERPSTGRANSSPVK